MDAPVHQALADPTSTQPPKRLSMNLTELKKTPAPELMKLCEQMGIEGLAR